MSAQLPSLLLKSCHQLTRTFPVSTVSCRTNYTHTQFSVFQRMTKPRYRTVPHQSEKVPAEPRVKVPKNFSEVYPEFLPNPRIEFRNKIREKLERMDMLKRRKKIEIPEFYVGSIVAVTVSDPYATDKSSRFVGICIDRGGHGFDAWCILRNVVDHQGLEIRYELYCPVISSIDTLRLERRVDDQLLYLRDALPEYSTFPLDMEAELIAEGTPVPFNDVKVKMLPRRWTKKWERFHFKGIDYADLLTEEDIFEAKKKLPPQWEKYDLMKEYRASIPEEDKETVFRDVAPHYPSLRATERRYKRRA